MSNKVINKGAVCSHTSENLGVIVQGKKLIPINGKFIWHIDEDSITPDMDKYKVIYAFEQAFSKWQPFFYPIDIQATGDISKAQIVIKFKKNGDAGLPFPFGNGVLAYAYAPDGLSIGLHADMFFNEAYQWGEMHKDDQIYLFKVAVHEIGHVFNFSHSTDITDILYPIYQPNGNVIITKDTHKALYDLYKDYGVKSPNIVSNDTPKTLTLKDLFKSKGDLARLSMNQLNVIGSFLNLDFTSRDRTQNKINKIWEAIST